MNHDMSRYYGAFAVLVAALPLSVFAAGAAGPDLGWFKSIVSGLADLVALAVPLLIGIALVVFIWGVIQFIMGDDKTRPEGKQKMLWGVVGLFVIVSVWGIVKLIQDITNVKGGGQEIGAPKPPSASS